MVISPMRDVLKSIAVDNGGLSVIIHLVLLMD